MDRKMNQMNTTYYVISGQCDDLLYKLKHTDIDTEDSLGVYFSTKEKAIQKAKALAQSMVDEKVWFIFSNTDTTKVNNVAISINEHDNVVISYEKYCRSKQKKSVTKKVVVEGEEYSKTIEEIEYGEWEPDLTVSRGRSNYYAHEQTNKRTYTIFVSPVTLKID